MHVEAGSGYILSEPCRHHVGLSINFDGGDKPRFSAPLRVRNELFFRVGQPAGDKEAQKSGKYLPSRQKSTCRILAIFGAVSCVFARNRAQPIFGAIRQRSLYLWASQRKSRSAPGWDRTSDHRFRRPVLYPLSYGHNDELLIPPIASFFKKLAEPCCFRPGTGKWSLAGSNR